MTREERDQLFDIRHLAAARLKGPEVAQLMKLVRLWGMTSCRAGMRMAAKAIRSKLTEARTTPGVDPWLWIETMLIAVDAGAASTE